MPTSIQAALQGVVQGLTEFLPVSSSAHLILARLFFGFDGERFGLAFDVACHVGTLIAVVVYFRRELGATIEALPYLFAGLTKTPSDRVDRTDRPVDGREKREADARLIWLLVIGTVPAVIAGLLFKNQIEEQMRTPSIAAAMLAIGGVLFLVAERAGSKARTAGTITWADAFWIGCAQAVALVPGVSRSGATLTVALFLGLRRTDAARFIFLLSIPAILGAAASEAPHLLRSGLGDARSLFAIGFVTSAIVGYATVKCFIRYLGLHSLAAFAWYRLALATVVAGWMLRA